MAIKIKGTTIINDEDAFIDFAGNTGLKLPVGTSAQRPAGATGQLRYNSTDNTFEGYDGTEWGPISGAGGTTNRRQINTVIDLGDLVTLGNSILGGDNVFPDGPDVLTVSARLLEDPSAVSSANPFTVGGRISWSESQA